MDNEKIVVRADPYMAEDVPWYLEKLNEFSAAIDNAIEQGDLKELANMGHRMGGTGSSYGFDAVSEIGLGLERAAKEKNMADVREWADKLSNYLERLEVLYE